MREEWEAVELFPGKYQEGSSGVSEVALPASLRVPERAHSSESWEGVKAPRGSSSAGAKERLCRGSCLRHAQEQGR